MTEKEANGLANHIAKWSANEQITKHKEGLNPEVRPIGDGDIFVVILKGKYNYHVWSWHNWRQDFEPDLVLEDEEQIA
jgi:hypothetical protein